jgi:Recombination endonuclease VII
MRWSQGWAKNNEAKYYALLAHQDYGCGICGSQRKTLVVDHDHRTKQIRGLLCESCNGWLGHEIDKFGREFLIAALSYVVHPPAGWLDDQGT